VNTASGIPDVTINAKSDKVKPVLLNQMASNAYVLTGQTENTLTFTKQMDVNQQFWVTLGLGSAYSSQPVLIATCTLIPLESGSATRVIGHIGVDMRNPFGGQQGMSLDHGKAGAQFQSLLMAVKNNVEAGPATSNQPKPPRE
jgi:hypothetical protein